MMQITKYLLEHSLDDLSTEHAIKHRFSSDGLRVTLNYEIFAKKGVKIVEECRGLVLGLERRITSADIVGNVTVMARPMDRFYNEGELDVEIDWSSVTTQEKLDGTMCILYHDHTCDTWRVGTRNVPDADVELDAVTGDTFHSLFMHYLDDETKHKLDKEVTYVFELVTAKNRVVVSYPESKHGIYLLATRETQTGNELDPDDHIERQNVTFMRPRVYSLRTCGDIMRFVSSQDPRDLEGCVIRDSASRRMKIKNPAWCFISRLTDSVRTSPRDVIRLALSDTDFSTLDYDLVTYVNVVQANVSAFCARVDELVASRDKVDRKTFALSIKSEPGIVQSAAFQSHFGSTRAWLEANVSSDAFATSYARCCYLLTARPSK